MRRRRRGGGQQPVSQARIGVRRALASGEERLGGSQVAAGAEPIAFGQG